MTDKVLIDIADDIATIRLNDPDRLNALTEEGYAGLIDAFATAQEHARVVVLTGSGRAFCSGASLTSGRMGEPAETFDGGALLERYVNPLMRAIRDLPIPFVAAVNGAAAGVGCSLALSADLIVAADTAYFLQAFSRIGLVPDGGSPYLLAAAVGRVRAMEMMLLGDRLPATTALQWGLINRIVPAADLPEAARALARRLADGPTATLGQIRRLAWAALDATWPEQLALERDAQRVAGCTAEFAEGVAAFVAKRPADFRRLG